MDSKISANLNSLIFLGSNWALKKPSNQLFSMAITSSGSMMYFSPFYLCAKKMLYFVATSFLLYHKQLSNC